MQIFLHMVLNISFYRCGRSSGVERNLAKVDVEGSNPFTRSNNTKPSLVEGLVLLRMREDNKNPRHEGLLPQILGEQGRADGFSRKIKDGVRWRSHASQSLHPLHFKKTSRKGGLFVSKLRRTRILTLGKVI